MGAASVPTITTGPMRNLLTHIVCSIIATWLLAACQSTPGVLCYDTAADVHLHGWTLADTLSYPIFLAERPTPKQPLTTGTDYTLFLGIRHNSQMRLERLPMQVILQQVDTVGGVIRPLRILSRSRLEVVLRQADTGQPLGHGWGDVRQLSVAPVQPYTLSLPEPGTYQLQLLPDIDASQSVTGLSAICVELWQCN